MIDVGMTQDHGVDGPDGHRERVTIAGFFPAGALHEATFQEYRGPAGPHDVERPGHLPGRTEELELEVHDNPVC